MFGLVSLFGTELEYMMDNSLQAVLVAMAICTTLVMAPTQRLSAQFCSTVGWHAVPATRSSVQGVPVNATLTPQQFKSR
jgi:hypothetical protein